VIGVPDRRSATGIKAIVGLQTDARGKVNEEEIKSYCRERLADTRFHNKSNPRRAARTDVGKVSRRELRDDQRRPE